MTTKPRRGIRLPATPPTTAIPSPATHLAIGSIRRDPGIQQRVGIAPALVDDYAETIADWIERAPVVVFDDGQPGYWLADGFHRVAAAERSGLDTIPAAVRQGTRRDAMLFAVGANRMQGQRPTRADKRRAVETLLADPEWSAWSDRRIADEAGVSPTTVGNIRREVEVSSLDTCGQAPTDVAGVRTDAPPPGDAPEPPTRIGKDGKAYPAKAPGFIETAIAEGAIHPEMQRKDAEAPPIGDAEREAIGEGLAEGGRMIAAFAERQADRKQVKAELAQRPEHRRAAATYQNILDHLAAADRALADAQDLAYFDLAFWEAAMARAAHILKQLERLSCK
jgi:hypothetical protein